MHAETIIARLRQMDASDFARVASEVDRLRNARAPKLEVEADEKESEEEVSSEASASTAGKGRKPR